MKQTREEQAQFVKDMTCRRTKNTAIAIQAVAEWNALYPIGTNVWVTDSDGSKKKASTRTSAAVKYDEAVLYITESLVAHSLSTIRPLKRKKKEDEVSSL